MRDGGCCSVWFPGACVCVGGKGKDVSRTLSNAAAAAAAAVAAAATAFADATAAAVAFATASAAIEVEVAVAVPPLLLPLLLVAIIVSTELATEFPTDFSTDLSTVLVRLTPERLVFGRGHGNIVRREPTPPATWHVTLGSMVQLFSGVRVPCCDDLVWVCDDRRSHATPNAVGSSEAMLVRAECMPSHTAASLTPTFHTPATASR